MDPIEWEPEITVVIAAWNEGPRIESCIRSLLELDYPGDKLSLLVIGGGTDNTRDVCQRLRQEGVIRFIPEATRRGKWTALNDAIEHITTDVIAFTDGDCRPKRDWLRNLTKHAKDVDIVNGAVISPHFKSPIAKLYASYFFIANFVIPLGTRLFGPSFFIGQNSLVKMHVFKRLRFKDSVVEDMRFALETRRLGLTLRKVVEPVVICAIPASLHDFRIEVVRVFEGMYAELLDWRTGFFALLALVLTTLTLVAWPFYFYALAQAEVSALLSLVIMWASIALAIKVLRTVLRAAGSRYLLYLPLFYTIVCVFSVEAMLRILVRRRIGWPTLDKVVD